MLGLGDVGPHLQQIRRQARRQPRDHRRRGQRQAFGQVGWQRGHADQQLQGIAGLGLSPLARLPVRPGRGDLALGLGQIQPAALAGPGPQLHELQRLRPVREGLLCQAGLLQCEPLGIVRIGHRAHQGQLRRQPALLARQVARQRRIGRSAQAAEEVDLEGADAQAHCMARADAGASARSAAALPARPVTLARA